MADFDREVTAADTNALVASFSASADTVLNRTVTAVVATASVAVGFFTFLSDLVITINSGFNFDAPEE